MRRLFAALLLVLSGAGAGSAESPYAPRGFDSQTGDDMNTSVLVFRDMNRNGVYDLADRPMRRVAVELKKPDGSTLLAWTNVNGFANYRMSAALRDREVVDPGHYSFRVLPPPGWSVTTGNAVQDSDYVALPGAPGDMIALKTTHPVGLAADLTISGIAPAGTQLSATGPGGAKARVTAGADAHFSFPAVTGDWRIEASSGKTSWRRQVTVAQSPVILSAFSAAAGPDAKPLPKRHVVGFDDLMTTASVVEVPSGYGGLDWYNVVAMHQRFTVGPGYINTTMSGEFIAYNSSGHPAEVSSPKPFDFQGAYFGAGWDGAEGETLMVKAWRGADLTYQDELSLSAYSPVYFAADYRHITRLEIRTRHYWQAAIDDFAYRTRK